MYIYVFGGWYDNPEFYGEKIERIDKGNIGNRTFYAKWILEKFNINLNVNSNYTDFISAEIESTNSAIKNHIFKNMTFFK